jgi:hypothetical protein
MVVNEADILALDACAWTVAATMDTRGRRLHSFNKCSCRINMQHMMHTAVP